MQGCMNARTEPMHSYPRTDEQGGQARGRRPDAVSQPPGNSPDEAYHTLGSVRGVSPGTKAHLYRGQDSGLSRTVPSIDEVHMPAKQSHEIKE